MKKLIALLTATLLIPAAATAADGTLTFNTDDGLADGPFVFNTDGTTKLDSSFVGQIWAGADGNSLAAVGPVAQFGLFNGAVNAGVNGIIFNGSSVTVSGVTAGGSGVYQIRAWEGNTSSTFAAATKRGQSANVTATFGGDTGSGSIPGPNVDQFSSFSLALVPEPTTVTLGLLGLGGLIASRRRKTA
jgi:hypothetical protein